MCNRNNIYFSHKFLKINEIYHSECLKFIHKFHNNNIPLAFRSYFNYASDVHQYNTRYASNSNFYVPKVHKNYGLRCPSYTGSRLWSQISPSAKTLSFDRFKKFCFNYLLARYNTLSSINFSSLVWIFSGLVLVFGGLLHSPCVSLFVNNISLSRGSLDGVSPLSPGPQNPPIFVRDLLIEFCCCMCCIC